MTNPAKKALMQARALERKTQRRAAADARNARPLVRLWCGHETALPADVHALRAGCPQRVSA